MSCSVLCSTGRVYRNDKLLFPPSPSPLSTSSTTTMYSNLSASAISKDLRRETVKQRLQGDWILGHARSFHRAGAVGLPLVVVSSSDTASTHRFPRAYTCR
ncbi:hypothetical protein BHM03_00013789 [Ensete ventricosum]|nr:hypothetical protein BHM03_00013789 [Ensete ventricosum]